MNISVYEGRVTPKSLEKNNSSMTTLLETYNSKKIAPDFLNHWSQKGHNFAQMSVSGEEKG